MILVLTDDQGKRDLLLAVGWATKLSRPIPHIVRGSDPIVGIGYALGD